MSTLAEVRHLISDVFEEIGVDSYDARLDKNTWGIAKGSAGGIIALAANEQTPDYSILYAAFRIMKVPASKSLPFFRRLLEINLTLNGRAAFAVDGENIVWLTSGRFIRDLNHSEIVGLILYTLELADLYDDQLLNEFGRDHTLT